MKTSWTVSAVAAIFLLGMPADLCAESRAMFGAGTITCAEWQIYRRADKSLARYQAEAWVDGYLSGYNVASAGADFLISQPKAIAMYAWIDNYCASTPLDHLANATTALKNELLQHSK